MTASKGVLRYLMSNKRAVAALEYALIAAAIAATISVSVVSVGNKLKNTFNNIANVL